MQGDEPRPYDERSARIVGGPVEASAVGGHATFAYRISRGEGSIEDVSVHLPTGWIDAGPGSFEPSIAEIVRSRGRSVLEELLRKGRVPRALWFELDGSYVERDQR
jgi:hypothetical protein